MKPVPNFPESRQKVIALIDKCGKRQMFFKIYWVTPEAYFEENEHLEPGAWKGVLTNLGIVTKGATV